MSTIIRFTSVDPLAEKFYSVSPYAYTFNNPIRFVDVKGLYPESVLIKHSGFFRDYYTYTAPVARLLSLVSNVSEDAIRNVRVVKRKWGEITPVYDADEGGGAITLGSGLNNASIIFTQNYFEDDPKSYSGHGYGQNTYSWLSLSSHEVGHLNHVGDAGGLISYLAGFGVEYLKHGHDNAPREIEADKGYNEFLGFNSYVNRVAGGSALINLIDSKKSDSEKIKQINKWFDGYLFNKTNKTKSFLDVMKNNYQSLQDGIYKWDGNDWVRQ